MKIRRGRRISGCGWSRISHRQYAQPPPLVIHGGELVLLHSLIPIPIKTMPDDYNTPIKAVVDIEHKIG